MDAWGLTPPWPAQHGEALLDTAATALSEDLRTFLGES